MPLYPQYFLSAGLRSSPNKPLSSEILLPECLSPSPTQPHMDLGSIQDSQSDTAQDMIDFEEEDLDKTVQALAHVINQDDPIQVQMLEIIQALKAREEALSMALSEVQGLRRGHSQTNLESATILSEETSEDAKEYRSKDSVLIRAGASRGRQEAATAVNKEVERPLHNKPPKPTPRASLIRKTPPVPKPRTIFPGHPDYPLSILNENYTVPTAPVTTQKRGTIGEDQDCKSVSTIVKDHCDEHLGVPPDLSSSYEHHCVSLNTTPISKSQSEDTLSSRNSGLAKREHYHSVACELQQVVRSTFPDTDQNLKSRWSQSAKSIYQDTGQKKLQWKQNIRSKGRKLKDFFKLSKASQSVSCLTPPHLPRPPDQ